MKHKLITPDIREIKTGTPAIKIGDKYFVGGIGGNFIPGGLKEEQVTLGMLDENLNFQKLSFSGTEPSNDGKAVVINEYNTWKGTLPLPESGGSSTTEYYKCVSVDTVNKTWTGYKLVLSDGVHTLEDMLTEGLSYLTTPPEVGGVYNETAELSIAEVMGYDSVSAIPTGFTSNTSIEGYTVDQSHGAGSYPQAWCVFNQNYTTGEYAWWTGSIGVSPGNPAWFSIEVPEAFVPVGIFIMNEVVSPENFMDAIFQGSNNGIDWDDLLEITGSPSTTGLKQTFDVYAGNAYKFFRMYFTASHSSGVSVQAFQIFRKSTTVTRVPASRL